MVAYRCHGQAPSVGAVGRQLGRTSVASDELLKIVYNLERVPSGEPDNQLDVWAVALRGGTPAGDDDVTWEELGTATLYGMDPYRNRLVGTRPVRWRSDRHVGTDPVRRTCMNMQERARRREGLWPPNGRREC
jgi:hypothetical protein